MFIGSGSFTNVYRVAKDTVEVLSICPSKQAYAEFSQGNKFAPKIEKIGHQRYRMPEYPQYDAEFLDDESLVVYCELQKLNCTRYEVFCNGIIDSEVLREEDKEALLDLANDVANYINPDDLVFEIFRRNLTHDGKGNLILLDCFFSRSLLDKVMDYDNPIEIPTMEAYSSCLDCCVTSEELVKKIKEVCEKGVEQNRSARLRTLDFDYKNELSAAEAAFEKVLRLIEEAGQCEN